LSTILTTARVEIPMISGAPGMPRRYPYLVLHRHRWVVRMVVPIDVREVLGHAVFKVSTGETDEHRARVVAEPIIANIKKRIKAARANLESPAKVKIDELAGE
jgi:hypothetical protein